MLTEHHLEFLSVKGGCTGSSESTLINLLDISCHGSFCFMSNFEILADLCSSADWFDSNLVGNPEDRFPSV